MNVRHGLKLGLFSLAVVALCAPSASASIIGHLSVGNCAGGGVTVSFSVIDWSPGSPVACLQSGIGTNLTSTVSGPLVPPLLGTINDLPPNGGIFGFMTFGTLLFDLAAPNGFGPPVAPECSVNPAVGNSCSIVFMGMQSPFILTTTATGTSVTLLAHGTIVDPAGGPVSNWNGAFTTQINGQTPSQIRTTVTAPGGSISSTFSGEFDVVVPEPMTMALIGGGLIALAAIKRRKVA
jgi:PEP-CTERM motif